MCLCHYKQAGEGTFFYSGHIDKDSDIEKAFRLIREAIGKIAALV
jgi:hypothetical protein